MWRAIEVAGKDARKIGKKTGTAKKQKGVKKRIITKKHSS
jgi:hypothetical protein